MKTNEFLPVKVPACTVPGLKEVLDRLAHNQNVILQQVFNAAPYTHVDGSPASYFVDPGGTGTPSLRHPEPLKIQLTSAVNISTGLATAKFLVWDSGTSAYVVTGTQFDAYDIYGKWRHSLSGDRGWLGYDSGRDVAYLLDMDSPFTRRITLGSNLASGNTTHVSATDTDTSQSIAKVFGTFIKSGNSIQASSNEVSATWYPKADNGDGTYGKWRATLSRECLL